MISLASRGTVARIAARILLQLAPGRFRDAGDIFINIFRGASAFCHRLLFARFRVLHANNRYIRFESESMPRHFSAWENLDARIRPRSNPPEPQPSTQTKLWLSPIQLPTTAQNETFGGVTYHIEGELVPALAFGIEHHRRLFRASHSALERPGGADRTASDERRVQADAGRDAVSAHRRERAGTHRLQPRRRGTRLRPAPRTRHGVDVREHQWLAATDNVDYTFTRVQRRGQHPAGRHGLFHRYLFMPGAGGHSLAARLRQCV